MSMQDKAQSLFTQEILDKFFPPERADEFFEAMYGDADDGAYDIRLIFRAAESKTLHFAFELHQRPGKCLACNLTYGLPQVFMRHPLINLKGLAEELGKLAGWDPAAFSFQPGRTEEISSELHIIPLRLQR